MNINSMNTSRMINSSRFGITGSKEEMALNINVVRTRESRRNKRRHLDLFSL